VLGQPSTTRAIPLGYSASNQVQCWYSIAIRSLGGDPYTFPYVSTELTYSDTGPYPEKGMLRARSFTVGDWERYTICYDYTDASYSIYSPAAGAWVSTELLYTGIKVCMLRARAYSVGPWEKYLINTDASGVTSIWSLARNLYVSAELTYDEPYKGMLRARNNTVGPFERFVLQSGL
jgi:hypothetical protein